MYTLSIKVQQETEYTTKRGIHTYANTRSTHTKLSQDIIKYYTLYVYYIITKFKRNIYRYVYKSSQVERGSRESKGKSGTKGLELVRLLAKESLIFGGWLHFDPGLGI